MLADCAAWRIARHSRLAFLPIRACVGRRGWYLGEAGSHALQPSAMHNPADQALFCTTLPPDMTTDSRCFSFPHRSPLAARAEPHTGVFK